MRKFNLVLLALVALFHLQACTIAKVSSRGSIPILLNQPADDMEVVEHVKVEKFVSFQGFSNEFDINQLLAKEIADKKPDAIANVSVNMKINVKAYLLNYVTCWLANARLVTVEADFMQFADPNNPKKRKKGGKK